MKSETTPPRPTGRDAIEWPTWAVLTACYALFAIVLTLWGAAWPLIAVPAAIAVALHSSLQHEVLHGHPTRNSLLNELLVALPLGLAIPYRRFRDLHLKHHNDERLTDPHDDPESFYLEPAAWGTFSPVARLLFTLNATFLGRLTIGPALAMFGFWRAEIRLMRAGNRAVQGAWVRHLIGIIVLLAILWAAGVPIWQYALFAAYPGLSLIMVRSFIEHRAAEETAHRTAVVEACLFWRLLFLNNNFHAVHHNRPSLAWYKLGALWQAERDHVLARNGGYLIPGYGAVLRRWGLRQREPVVHPYSRIQAPPLPGETP